MQSRYQRTHQKCGGCGRTFNKLRSHLNRSTTCPYAIRRQQNQGRFVPIVPREPTITIRQTAEAHGAARQFISKMEALLD